MLLSAVQATDPWSVVTAIGTMLAAVAACISALASWKAAKSSATTSEHATEALAATILPRVRTRGTYQRESGHLPVAFVAVSNDVEFPARDIEVEVVRRDGRRFVNRRDILEKDDDPIVIEIGELGEPTPDGWTFLLVGRVTIRFSDERKLARYERVEDYTRLSEPPGVPTVSERRL
jgi:hypothetical protein